MKLKLAIIFGILIWVITFVAAQLLNPIFTNHLPNINIIVPIIMNITTLFFGIVYIRNIDTNEVVEGFLVGVIFIVVDIICDYAFIIVPHTPNYIFTYYQLHITSTIILTLLITTFLGYLAQMNIDLK